MSAGQNDLSSCGDGWVVPWICASCVEETPCRFSWQRSPWSLCSAAFVICGLFDDSHSKVVTGYLTVALVGSPDEWHWMIPLISVHFIACVHH